MNKTTSPLADLKQAIQPNIRPELRVIYLKDWTFVSGCVSTMLVM